MDKAFKQRCAKQKCAKQLCAQQLQTLCHLLHVFTTISDVCVSLQMPDLTFVSVILDHMMFLSEAQSHLLFVSVI